jgi:hypothetical protein
MAMIDAAHIQSLTKQLDVAVPREGHVEVVRNPDDFDYTQVRANQLGYLRLGIEFLKAAHASPESGEGYLLKLDLAYLEGFDHDSFSFERREEVWSPMWSEERPARSQRSHGACEGAHSRLRRRLIPDRSGQHLLVAVPHRCLGLGSKATRKDHARIA